MFKMKYNPILGKMEWELVDEDYDYYQEVARSGYADMLHDSERNQKYHVAVKAAVKMMHEMGKAAHVLDIGTGTGLLAMMAANCGADSVVACEAFPPMAKCAKRIISGCKLADKIQIIPKRSTEIVVGKDGDMKRRANILVTEVFDTELIGEGAINTFNHAHKELLEPDCIVVPSRATLYAQVVECSLALAWHQPTPWRAEDPEVVVSPPPETMSCSGAPAVHDIQLNQLGENSFRSIIPPTPVLRFDWSGKSGEIPSDTSKVIELQAEASGKAQVVFMWWDLEMDQEGEIVLSCAPYWAHPSYQCDGSKQMPQDCDLPWRDHWMQAVYFLHSEVSLHQGDSVTLRANHDEYSLWFELVKGNNSLSEKTSHPICSCGFHASYSRTRIGSLNDKERRKKYASVISRKLKELCAISGDASDTKTILCLSEGSLLGLITAKMAEKMFSGPKFKVFCEDKNLRSKMFWDTYVQSNHLGGSVEILEEVGSVNDLGGVKASMVLGEPHYCSSLLPWHNLHFWYRITQLSSLLHPDATLMPVGASIWAMAVQFKDLWKIRAPVECVEGFKMEDFDLLIEASRSIGDDLLEPQPLWEYPCRAVSLPCKLFQFDFGKALPEDPLVEKGVFSVESDCLECNGIAVWVDWDLDGNPKNTISTGPVGKHPKLGEFVSWDMFTRQGVRLLSPTLLPINFEARFIPRKCDLSLSLQAEGTSSG